MGVNWDTGHGEIGSNASGGDEAVRVGWRSTGCPGALGPRWALDSV